MMLAHYRQVSDKALEQIRSSRSLQEALIRSDRTDFPYGEYICIGEYWQAINFLLNQLQCNESNVAKVIFGGIPLDKNEIWFDFGPIRYIAPKQVQETSTALNSISPAHLVSSFNSALMAEHEIYPDAWWTTDPSKNIESLKHYYNNLVNFFNRAAKRHNYVLTYITA